MTEVLVLAAIVAFGWVLFRPRDQTPSTPPEPFLRLKVETEPAEAHDDPGKRDAWEGGFWEATEPRDIEARLQIEYTDGAGSETTRIVRIRSYDGKLYGGILIGHCELRDATRTFRFDRIREAVDVSTGEVVTDVRAHLNRLYIESGRAARDTLSDEYTDLLRVLLYVARADGQFREAERIIVRRCLRGLVGDPRVTDAMLDGLFLGIPTPSLTSFKRAVGRVLSAQLVDPERLRTICHEIVATQKTASSGEQEALAYIDSRIARASAVPP